MKIKDILQRDPGTFPLVNQGQARLVDSHSEKALAELRGELSTFVCEGQYADGVQKIIRSYLDSIGKTNQKAAWGNPLYRGTFLNGADTPAFRLRPSTPTQLTRV